MDSLIVQFNAIVNVTMAFGLAWAVLSKRISDGVVIKVGLILMALGFGSKIFALYDGLHCADIVSLSRSNFLVHTGVIICVAGYCLRRRAGQRAQRRVSDWAELNTRPMEGNR